MGSGITNFTSIIEAKSLGTADIDKMTAAIDKQSASLDKLGEKSKKVNDNAGFNGFAQKVKQGLSDPLGSIETSAISALEALGPIGAVSAGVGAALAGIAIAGFSAAKSLAAYGQNIENVGLRTGLTKNEVVQFGFAAKLVDQDVGVFERSMRGLSAALTDNSAAGTKARETLRDIGVVPRSLNGELKPTGQLLLEISAALNALPNTWQRNEAGMQIFKRAWLDIAPAILNLSTGVKLANQQGFFAPSDQQLKQFDDYDKKVTVAEEKLAKLLRTGKQWLAEVVFPAEDLAAKREARDRKERGIPDEIPPPAGPGTARSSIADALIAGDANRINQDRAAGNSLLNAARTRIDATLEGLRFRAEEAKRKYEEAYNSVRTLSDVGATAAQREIDTVAKLKSNYEGLSTQLKVLEKDESRRVALLERMRDIVLSGGTALQVGSGPLAKIITGEEIERANRQALRRPSLFGRGPNPFELANTLNAQQPGRVDRPQGLTVEGGELTFISPESERSIQVAGESVEQLNERWKGYATARLATEQQFLTNEKLIADAAARLIELRSGPGSEVQTARDVATFREQALQRERDLAGDITRYREESKRNELDLTLKIAEIERQRLDNLRSEAGRFFDALLQGQKGLQQFARDFLLGEARKVFQNLVTEAFKGGSLNLGIPGKVFQGTIFGKDPLQGATDLLKVSTDVNNVETRLNSQALRELTAALAAARAAAVSPSGGGGAFSPSFSNLQGLVKQGEQIGLGTLDAAGFERDASGLVRRGGGADLYNLPLTHPSGATDPRLLPEGWGTNIPVSSGSKFTAGKGVAIAGAAIGAGVGVYSGIKQGGVAGALTAAGSLAGAGGAILTLAGVSGPAAPILAGVGLALTALPALFGALDPKKRRAEEISSYLDAHKFQGPDPVSITRDLYGRDISYDQRGNLRPIEIQDNRQYHVSAIDSQDVSRFFEKHTAAVNRGVARAIDDGGELVPKMASALGLQ